MTKITAALMALLVVAAAPVAPVARAAPSAQVAATCSDYSTQAEAQRAGDTRDADGDGIYCESLPCPCSTAAPGSAKPPTPPKKPAPGDPKNCTTPSGVQHISFSATKYANIRAHFLAAVKKGWPKKLVLNRAGAAERRDRLLQAWPTKKGYDRDEYPPAVGRGKGKGLQKGSNPTGWKADVRYVPSSENRSHGSTLGAKLHRFCSGTRFQYVFY